MSTPSHTVPSSATAAAPKAQPNTITTLLVFVALGIVCGMDRFIVAALLTPIKSQFALTDEQAGRVWTAFTIANVAAVFIFGYLGNRIGRKGPILWGLILWSAATIGSGFAAGLGSLLVWRALVGFGEGSFLALSPSWLADVFGPKWRNLVFGVFNSTNYIGVALGYTVGGGIAASKSWQHAFWFAGVPGIALAIWLFFIREPSPGHSDGEATATISNTSLRDTLGLFKLPAFVIHMVGKCAYGYGLSGLLWGPMFFHRAFDLSNRDASAFFGNGFLIFGVSGSVLGGYLGSAWLRRLNGGYAILLALASIATAAGFYFGFGSTDIQVARIGVLTGLFFNGVGGGPNTTVLVEAVPVALRNVASTIGLLLGALFAVLSSVSIGLVSDHFNLRTAILLVPLSFLIAGLSWVVLTVQTRRSSRSPVTHPTTTPLAATAETQTL